MSRFLKETLGSLQDKAMFALIGSKIIYNVSWEDPRIDCELLNLTGEDTILMLTSGGCNVLDMALEGAKTVVAADLNPRQNALLELKCVCIQQLEHEEFFQLFALSNLELFKKLYPTKLQQHLSQPAREFWDEHGSVFFKNVHWGGMSGVAAHFALRMARAVGLGGLIDEVRDCPTLEDQRAVYRRYASRVTALCNMVNFTKRLWCPFIAVPANQLDLFDGNIARHAVDNLFLNTHIAKDNYFYHGYMYGTYTRECCPRYLKAENFAKLRAAVNAGVIHIRTGTLKDVAASYADGFFTRYILLDHMDWMPMSMVCDEWSVFVQKANRPKCRVLWRSFSPDQHIAPLKYLHFHPENVKAALSMYPDRVSMYNSTHLATIPDDFTVLPREEYAPRATCCDDLTVLSANWLHPITKYFKGASDHQGELESFYASQAGVYDVFRHRFLHGRKPMIEAMPTPVGGTWVDIGGGTAANLEHLGPSLDNFSKVVVLDLCRPLLDVAKARVAEKGWENVELVCGDACDPSTPGLPAPGTVDVVTMSYSLTMIPDWRKALENAFSLLKPGGYIAVSDFTVRPQHSAFTRTLWPFIFKGDGVRPCADHLDELRSKFNEVHCVLDKGGFPYVPLLRAPYYFFVGQKPVTA